MPHNVGSTDRWVRVIIGIGLLALVFLGPRTAWGYLGLIPLITGVFGYCPLYHVIGRKSIQPQT
jgi:hypothetical protein